MRTTLERPDPLFARLEILATSERMTLKQPLRSCFGQRTSAPSPRTQRQCAAATLPRIEGVLTLQGRQLCNAVLFELLEPWAARPICRI